MERGNGPTDAPDQMDEMNTFAPGVDEPDLGDTAPARGSHNSAPRRGPEASGAGKPSRKRKASALEDDDDDDDASSMGDATVDEGLKDILLTYIAEVLPLGRRSSPTSKRHAPNGRRSSGRGQDSTPAVRELLEALLTSKKTGGGKYAGAEGEGSACDECGKRIKRACDMK
jgi:hypothetical protein